MQKNCRNQIINIRTLEDKHNPQIDKYKQFIHQSNIIVIDNNTIKYKQFIHQRIIINTHRQIVVPFRPTHTTMPVGSFLLSIFHNSFQYVDLKKCV